MAYSQHTLFGGALAAVVTAACITGLMITGGPGEARREKEDAARLQSLRSTAYALACYHKVKGDIPEDTALVQAALNEAATGIREPEGCRNAAVAADPVTGEPFRLQRDGARVTHICATFATAREPEDSFYGPSRTGVIPGLMDKRASPGEECFELNLNADLDTYR